MDCLANEILAVLKGQQLMAQQFEMYLNKHMVHLLLTAHLTN